MRRLLLFTVIFVFSVVSLGSSFVYAQTRDGRDVFDLLEQGVLDYDPECPDVSADNVSPGQGSPTGTTFPNLDPDAMARAIDQFIEQANSNSRMAGLGDTIVAGAQNSNINPFLIVAHARMESSMSDPGDYNVRNGNNSFGRTATSSQPNFQGARLWYRWSSVKASVDHTAPENRGAVGGGDIAAYIREQYPEKIDSGDLDSYLEEYVADSSIPQYTENVKRWVSEMAQEAERLGGPPASDDQGRQSIYMVGDSIAQQAEGILKNTFSNNGYSSFINGNGGRSITQAGNNNKVTADGSRSSGLRALDNNRNRVAQSDIIVINLGGNQRDGNIANFRRAVGRMIDKARDYNADADIYWVNIIVPVRNKNAANQAIQQVASSKNANVIDANSQDIELLIDTGVNDKHPTQAGYRKYASYVVNQIKQTSGAPDTASDGAGSQPSSTSVPEGCICPATTLEGNDNSEVIFNFYVDEGYTPEQAAGFVGNYFQESGLDPTIENSIGAFGLAQWLGGRKSALQAFAQQQGKPVSDLGLQLDFSIHELKGSESAANSAIKAVGDSGQAAVREVTVVIRKQYERPGEAEANDPARIAKALEVYGQAGGGPASPSGTPADSGSACPGGGGSTGQFAWPDGDRQDPLSSCFGDPRSYGGHTGIDVASPEGSDVYASDGGEVTVDGSDSVRRIVIDHGGGMTTHYLHNSSVNVSVGDSVSQGDKIGEVGSVGGGSTGAHIHFDIREDDIPQNPLGHLPEDGRDMGGCSASDTI